MVHAKHVEYIYFALVTSHQKVVDLDRRFSMVHGAEKE